MHSNLLRNSIYAYSHPASNTNINYKSLAPHQNSEHRGHLATDLWGRAICWDEDGSIVYNVEDCISVRKPLNNLVYARAYENGVLHPVVNVNISQLHSPVTAIPDAKILTVVDGNLTLGSMPDSIKIGSNFPLNEIGENLFVKEPSGSVSIDISLYTPNPL